MSGLDQTPAPAQQPTLPAKQTNPVVGTVPAALNSDGHDTRQWWALSDAERAKRMEHYNRWWWERHRRVMRWNDVLRACQHEVPR